MTLDLITANLPATISILANIVLAYLLQRRSVAIAEYSIIEKTCARLREENKALHQEVGKLQERTDLQPLLTAIHDWTEEGRNRFTAATAQLEENTKAVTMLVESNKKMLLRLFPEIT